MVGLDCLDGTPLLDIKPYFASTDSVPDAVVGWHKPKRSMTAVKRRAITAATSPPVPNGHAIVTRNL